jgi:hypothetical protein
LNRLNSLILSLLRERGAGADSAISAENLAGKASSFLNESVNGRQVRQVIHDLRISGQPICSGQNGFYWPASLQEVLNTADHEFRSEARSMLATARALREAGRRLFGGQLGML